MALAADLERGIQKRRIVQWIDILSGQADALKFVDSNKKGINTTIKVNTRPLPGRDSV